MRFQITPGMMKYCVVGNISRKPHVENGIIRYGTRAFASGRKVYISRYLSADSVDVLGINRHDRYCIDDVPLAMIDNIRPSKTFKLSILEWMTDYGEYPNMWWRYKKEDKIKSEEYAEILNRIKSGDTDAYEQYVRDRQALYE